MPVRPTWNSPSEGHRAWSARERRRQTERHETASTERWQQAFEQHVRAWSTWSFDRLRTTVRTHSGSAADRRIDAFLKGGYDPDLERMAQWLSLQAGPSPSALLDKNEESAAGWPDLIGSMMARFDASWSSMSAAAMSTIQPRYDGEKMPVDQALHLLMNNPAWKRADQVESGRALLRQLLKHIDVNAVDGTGSTALHLASARGHAAAVDVLIEHGAEVNRREWHEDTYRDRGTALHSAVVGAHPDVVARLLAAGANPNLTSLRFVVRQSSNTVVLDWKTLGDKTLNARNPGQDSEPKLDGQWVEDVTVLEMLCRYTTGDEQKKQDRGVCAQHLLPAGGGLSSLNKDPVVWLVRAGEAQQWPVFEVLLKHPCLPMSVVLESTAWTRWMDLATDPSRQGPNVEAARTALRMAERFWLHQDTKPSTPQATLVRPRL